MNILYLHQYFNTPSMNGGTRSYEMARRLVKSGFGVTVITCDRAPCSPLSYFSTRFSDIEGIKVIWIKLPYSNKLSFFASVISFISFAFAATFHSLLVPADIVFATSTPLSIALPALCVKFLRQSKFIFEVRDLWPQMPIALGVIKNPFLIKFLRGFESFVYRNASSVIALSPGMKDGVVSSGISSHKVTVIPNSCDNSLFSIVDSSPYVPLAIQRLLDQYPVIVYAGAFGILNGLDYFVDLAYQLRKINSSVRILLIGNGSQHKYLQSIASICSLSITIYIF